MVATYRDFLITLLANDAYNRGAFVNVRVGTNVIGTATLLPDFGEALTAAELSAYLGLNPLEFVVGSAADVGFNATSYTLDSGETVISYRGTDFRTSFDDGQILELFKDISAGWITALGIVDGPGIGIGGVASINVPLQTAYAELFFEQVTGVDPFGPAVTDVILTGHSLGVRRLES